MNARHLAMVGFASLVLSAPAIAATTLSDLGPNSFGIIQDGTSNTIQFGETTRVTVCFDNVTPPAGGIADGTSNTIIFGEGVGYRVTAGQVTPRGSIQQINDGTSNTIILGEIGGSFCLTNTDPLGPTDITDGTSNTIIIGENSSFDICFNNVNRGTGQITDGTSNTIIIGETESGLCYTGVTPDENIRVTGVPGPGALALLGAGLVALGAWARRRGRGSGLSPRG
jgi:hypothetical protein